MALSHSLVGLFSVFFGWHSPNLQNAVLCFTSITETAAQHCLALGQTKKSPEYTKRLALHRALEIYWNVGSNAQVISTTDILFKNKFSTAEDFWKRASSESASSKDEAALKDYEAAHLLDPAKSSYACDLVDEYVFLEHYDAAQKLADEVLKTDAKASVCWRGRGRAFYKNENYKAALTDYNAALSLQKTNANWWRERAYVQDELGNKQASIADYSEAIKLEPEDAATYGYRADAYDFLGKSDEALADYRKAVKLDPSAFNYSAEADFFVANDRLDEAAPVIERALKLDAKSAYAFMVAGRLAHKQKHYDDAIKKFKTAINLQPNQNRAKYYLAQTLNEQNKKQAALKILDGLLPIWKNSTELRDMIGVIQTDLEHYGEAEKALTSALAIDPNYFDALLDRALVRIRQEKWGEAREDATKAIALQPKYSAPFVRRAYAYWKLGDERDAKADYDQAVLNNPKSHLALEERGDFLRLTNHLDEAEKDAQASLALGEPSADTYTLLGRVAEALQKYSVAEENYGKAIVENPNDPWLIENRAWARIYGQKYVEAYADCNNMMKALINRPEPYYCRAEVNVGLAENKKALTDYEMALKLSKEYWPALYGRARIYTNLNRNNDAIVDFTKLIKLDYRKSESYFFRGTANENAGNTKQALLDYQEALKIADTSWAPLASSRLRQLQSKAGAGSKLDSRELPQFHVRGLSHIN
jgi:tetratricopeptide (TPR) repeat protein